jgi:hypothetical protein
MNTDDFYAYWGGMIDGRGTGLYGMMGNDEYESRQRTPDSNYSVGTTSSGSGYGDSSSPAVEFASEWTEEICDWIEEHFEWVPAWVGRTVRFTTALFFLVAASSIGCGLWLSVTAAVLGWFMPDVLIFAFKFTLYLCLAIVYLCVLVCVGIAMTTAAFALLYFLGCLLAA